MRFISIRSALGALVAVLGGLLLRAKGSGVSKISPLPFSSALSALCQTTTEGRYPSPPTLWRRDNPCSHECVSR
jgi:hypothetical protein